MIDFSLAQRIPLTTPLLVPASATVRATRPASGLTVLALAELLPEREARPSVALAHCGPAFISVAPGLPRHELAAQRRAPSTARAVALAGSGSCGAGQPIPVMLGINEGSSTTMARRRLGNGPGGRAAPPPGGWAPPRWRTRLRAAVVIGGVA